jgi:hypothetical protein
MTGSIVQSRDRAIEARLLESSLVVTPADWRFPVHSSPEQGAIAARPHPPDPPDLPRALRVLSQLLAFLAERGHLRLTTEYAEAWKPLREIWREKQENRDDPDAIEFRSDVARIYDRAVKRAVHAVETGQAAERQRGKLERYRYENLPPDARAAAVDLTIEVLDHLMRKSESLEEAKRMEAAKATIQGMVRELVDHGFLTITHDFRVAYETWRAEGKSADEDPGDPGKANEEAAAKKALQAAALASCKVAVFAAANSPEPAIRELFRPFKTRRLTTAEMSWVTSEARDILERLLFQSRIEHTAPQSREAGPLSAAPAQASGTFPSLAAGETEVALVANRPGQRTGRRGGSVMTGALLIAEAIGVAIGGTVGFLGGQRFEAERAAVRVSAYHDQAQKVVNDVETKAKQLVQKNLQAAAEIKTLKESLGKLRAAHLDLAGKNAELNRSKQNLSKQNQELAERVKANDKTLDELRGERGRRLFDKGGGYGKKK